ncbi:MAG: hypothetical protein ACXVAY_20915 [Mucilaginibacter sp.]
MKSKTIKKILLYTLATCLLVVVAIGVHIYYIYKPKAPTATSRIMARIDIKQKITQDDANKITAFLAHEKGIDHALVNPETGIVIFTFFPIKTSGDQIAKDFQSNFHYDAHRIIPSDDDLKNGCPVAGATYAYKIYKFISKII